MFAWFQRWGDTLIALIVALPPTFAACFFAGILWQRAHAAEVAVKAPPQVCTPVTQIIHDRVDAEKASADAEARISHVHDRVAAAAASASAAIDALPSAGACPAPPDPAGLDAWHDGIDRVRQSGNPVPADAADQRS
jgi:hypothetical protein